MLHDGTRTEDPGALVKSALLRALWQRDRSTDAFERTDEQDDAAFYAEPRLVPHLDELACRTIESAYGELLQRRGRVLDLMASWDSHLPPGLRPDELVGLGLNERELQVNAALTRRVIHDLNREPALPFPDASFDAVVCTASIDYLVHPFEVAAEIARVLRPGGLLAVAFSNRMFPTKAVRIWRESSEEARLELVRGLFASAGFPSSQTFISKGLPRPAGDRYASTGLPSDPVFLVYDEKDAPHAVRRPTGEELAARLVKDAVARGAGCPHCGQPLRRWQVPQTPFTEWDVPYFEICFNDACAYLLRGWSVMAAQGNAGFSYRFMRHPDRGGAFSVPVRSLDDLRDGIVD